MPVSENYTVASLLHNSKVILFDAVKPAKLPKHLIRMRNQRWDKRRYFYEHLELLGLHLQPSISTHNFTPILLIVFPIELGKS